MNNRKLIISAAGIIAASIGTYLLARRIVRNRQHHEHLLAHNPQSMIRRVMHKSKEVQA